MPSLYSTTAPPTWTVPTPILQRRPTAAPPTLIGYLFDPLTGDLATDGGGHIRYATAEQTAVQAAAFLVTVQQASYPIFSRAFGSDLEGCLGRDEPRATTERRIEEAMRSAIRQDARLRDIQDTTFDWSGDTALTATYTLVLASGIRIRQQRRLLQ